MVTATAEFSRPDASGQSVLSVTAKIAKGWHIYSLTQAKGGPIASKIKLDESKDFKPPAEYKPTKPPEVRTYPEAWKDLKIEEHHATVTWKGDFAFAAGVDPARLEIAGAVYAQACADQCIAPKNYRFTARLAKASGSDKDVSTARENGSAKSKTGSVDAKLSPRDGVWPPRPDRAGDIRLVSDEQPLLDLPGLPKGKLIAADSDSVDSPNGNYSHRDLEATIEGHIDPAAVVPGESAKLVLSIAPNPGWFFYGLADEPAKGQSKPTLIRVNAGGGLQVGRPEANSAPKSKQYALAGGSTVLYYDKPVTWTIPIEIPSSVSAGTHTIEGFVGLQTCNDTTCLVPHAVRFTGSINVGGAAGSQTAPLNFHRSSYTEAARAGGEAPARSPIRGDDSAALVNLPSFEPRNLSALPAFQSSYC